MHGYRTWCVGVLWHYAWRKFQAAIFFSDVAGVLEKMAYFTRSVLQRICILSGIDFKDPVEMEYQGAEISGKCHRNRICLLCTNPVRMDSDRTLAWGKVELYRLGTVSRNPDLLIDII